jgi:hypothetical protein
VAGDLTPAPSEPLIPRRREEVRVHRFRFAAAYLALAILAGVAVGAAVLFAGETQPPGDAAWSAWRPTTDEPDAAREIAEYVAGRYTTDDGGRLVAITASSPSFENVPVSAFVIRSSVDGGIRETIDTAGSMMYVLCGAGEACSVADGPSSEAQDRLLRREALELALYTFRYVDGARSVIVLLPPEGVPAEDEQPTTLFFQKQHLDAELRRPLQATLTLTSPIAQELLTRTDVVAVERLTAPRLFQYELTRVQDGSVFMLLAPRGLAAGR